MNVRHFSGGIREWLDRKLPLETGLAPAVAFTREPIAPTARPAARSDRFRPRGRWEKLFQALGDLQMSHLLGLWLAMVLVCGTLYWLTGFSMGGLEQHGQALPTGKSGFLAALYFSFVTALSIGYGDIVPVGIVRALAIVEGALGLLVFGGVVSKFVSRRQEQLIAEIHLTTFMDRIARVRTNLHMVLSELHALFGLCIGGGLPSERVLVRAESVALVLL
ncbi:MAG: hypothetical protein KGR26_02080, partial [Cyanobacteria bacterium REEB65]|nr:hypothetical protein [Cyanobacteria bacterium REEB65]